MCFLWAVNEQPDEHMALRDIVNLYPMTSAQFKTVYDTYKTYLKLGLDLPQLPPRQHLNVRGDLLPRPRLARPQFDVARYQLVPTWEEGGTPN